MVQVKGITIIAAFLSAVALYAIVYANASLHARLTSRTALPSPVPTSSSLFSATPTPSTERQCRWAFAIVVTKDDYLIDAPAVLAASIRRTKHRCDIDLVALLAPDVVHMNAGLLSLGFRLIHAERLPLQPDEVRNEFVRGQIVKSGCCGHAELLKLNIFELVEYDRVAALDMDTIVLGSLDPLGLFDEQVIYTKAFDEFLNGGFLFVRPDGGRVKDDVLDIIREGDFRYDGTGWRGSRIGYTYGGETIQGALAYYLIVERNNSISRIVSECTFNNMGNGPSCRDTPSTAVREAHFTFCQKPWMCTGQPAKVASSCAGIVAEWWRISHEIEDTFGLPRRPECPGGRYEHIHFPESARPGQFALPQVRRAAADPIATVDTVPFADGMTVVFQPPGSFDEP